MIEYTYVAQYLVRGKFGIYMHVLVTGNNGESLRDEC